MLLIAMPSFGIIKNWLTIGTALGNSLEGRKEIQYALLVRNWLQMEADRSGSIDDLWNDFTYMARKLGFTKLALRLGDSTCAWENLQVLPGIKERFVQHHLQIGNQIVVLNLSAPLDAMDNKKFQLLGELAAETWLNAARRWFQRHDATFELPGVSRPDLQPACTIRGESLAPSLLQ
jgi:hypothetical protein